MLLAPAREGGCPLESNDFGAGLMNSLASIEG